MKIISHNYKVMEMGHVELVKGNDPLKLEGSYFFCLLVSGIKTKVAHKTHLRILSQGKIIPPPPTTTLTSPSLVTLPLG